jgi:hypothetical protein
MPLNLANIRNNTRTVDLEYYGEPLKITYKPSEMTPAKESMLQLTDNEDKTAVLVTILCEALVSWDIMDGEKALAIKPDLVSTLPSALLLHIWDGMQEDMRPKARTGRR